MVYVGHVPGTWATKYDLEIGWRRQIQPLAMPFQLMAVWHAASQLAGPLDLVHAAKSPNHRRRALLDQLKSLKLVGCRSFGLQIGSIWLGQPGSLILMGVLSKTGP